MATPEETEAISRRILATIAGPRRVQGDAGEIEQHSLADLIEAHRYVASQISVRGTGRGIRFTRIIPNGTVDR